MNISKLKSLNIKKLSEFILNKVKEIKENPHNAALGMAAGVFIAATPTIPFHTALAIMLAAFIRGSKAAAALGVWVSNPVTIPIIYVANYKIGVVLLGKESCLLEISQIGNVSEMLKVGLDITVVMIVGGIILGIIPALLTYFLTIWIFRVFKIR